MQKGSVQSVYAKQNGTAGICLIDEHGDQMFAEMEPDEAERWGVALIRYAEVARTNTTREHHWDKGTPVSTSLDRDGESVGD